MQAISTKQHIDVMLAELPTVTAVGMNALAPIVKDSLLIPLFDKKGGLIGFQGGGRQVQTPDDRHKTIQENAGVETSWIELSDLLSFSDKKLKSIVDKKLLVVTALDLDKMGESGALSYGIDYFEKGLARLKTAVIKLKENGYEEFIITSDHGFLLGDESLETGKAPKLECADRRFAFGSERDSENLVSANFNQLRYGSSGSIIGWFVFERTTHLLINQGKTSFYHGGNTFQERIVPVITLSLTKNLPDSSGTYELAIQKMQGAMGFNRISIKPTSMTPGLFSIPKVEIQLISEDGVLVEIGDVVGAQRKGDVLTLPLNCESEIFFKLKDGKRSKANIFFKATQHKAVLINSECSEFFEVENYGLDSSIEKQEKRTSRSSNVAIAFPDSIPDEYHKALGHLAKHGSLTEKFLVNTLGVGGVATRKGRRFANLISEWIDELPFDIYIEQTAEGKEYRIKGSMNE